MAKRWLLLLLCLIVSPVLAHAQAIVVIERLADLTDVQTPFVDGEFFKWDSVLGVAKTAQPQFTDVGGVVADAQLGEVYVKADGTRGLSADWDAGAHTILASAFTASEYRFAGSISGIAVVVAPAIAGSPLLTWSTNTGFIVSTGDVGIVSGAMLANTAVTPATYGSATQTPQVVFDAKGRATSAVNVTIAPPFSAVTGSLACSQLPAGIGDVTSPAGSCVQTLANIGGVTMTLGSDATGDVYYRNSSGVLTRVAAGAQNTVFNMGASSVPAWTAAPTITGTNFSGTAASLTAGLATDTVSKTGTGTTYVTNTAPSVVGGSFIELTAFSLRDTAAANDLVLKSTSSTSLSADRILTFDVVNAARTLKISGNATVDQDVSTTGSPTLAQLTVGAGGIFTGSMNAPSMFSAGSGNSFVWINANSLVFAGTTSGQVTMTVPAVVGGNLTGCTGVPTVATGGISTTCTSDEQYKDVVGPFQRGLADLRDVQPIRFHWKRFDDPRPERAGFGARNVQASIPEAAWLVKQGDGEEVLTLSDRVILATVVNAVKELGAKVEALERR